MVYSKIKKILLILLCCFVVVFPFCCVAGLCAEDEETVERNTVTGLNMSLDRNYFTTGSQTIAYYSIEPGYIYHIYNNSETFNLLVSFSSDVPANNVVYYDVFNLLKGTSYSFISTDNDYLYIDIQNNSAVTVTREKMTSMNGAINDLVENVGVNSIWNIFDISINYIVIVVLVAFGIFIITRIVKKISKGKEGL